MPHVDLSAKIQTVRAAMHEQLIARFDADVPLDVKKFWFISSMCDPRFKKLTFKNDRMLTAAMRTNAEKWFSTEFNRNYKNKFNKVGTRLVGQRAATGMTVRRPRGT